MRLWTLGSGVVEPTARRASSAYAVEAGEDLILLDMGSGSLRGALAAGLDPRRARHVVLSHLHPDHTSDLVPFLFACNYATEWRPAPPAVRFAGPAGLAAFLEDLRRPWRWLEPRGWETEVEEGEPSLGGRGWTARAWPVEHGDQPALAWRFESAGRSLCYSGDTSYCEGLIRAARGVDLLLVECSVPEGQPFVPGHMTSADVGRAAAEAGVGRVVLTHLYPVADRQDVAAEVCRHYGGIVEKAEDGAWFDV